MSSLLLAILNHLLTGTSWARQRLSVFAGKVASFDIPPLRFELLIDTEGLFTAAQAGATADVRVTLPADTPFRLLSGLDSVMASAHVEGNAEFATELSFVLRHLRRDAEQDLSRIVGDAAASRIVRQAGRVANSQRQVMANLQANLAEYLTHENRLVLTQSEFSVLRAGIASLSSALDRCESRSRALQS